MYSSKCHDLMALTSLALPPKTIDNSNFLQKQSIIQTGYNKFRLYFFKKYFEKCIGGETDSHRGGTDHFV